MIKKLSPFASKLQYDKRIALVLQGGGALSSYQAGVYEAFAIPWSERRTTDASGSRLARWALSTQAAVMTSLFAAATTNALTGQSLIVSHGCFME